jgi:heat shock protein HtpX
MKRIFFVYVVNIAVVAVLGIVANLLGVNPLPDAQWPEPAASAARLRWSSGFGGAIISHPANRYWPSGRPACASSTSRKMPAGPWIASETVHSWHEHRSACQVESIFEGALTPLPPAQTRPLVALSPGCWGDAGKRVETVLDRKRILTWPMATIVTMTLIRGREHLLVVFLSRDRYAVDNFAQGDDGSSAPASATASLRIARRHRCWASPVMVVAWFSLSPRGSMTQCFGLSGPQTADDGALWLGGMQPDGIADGRSHECRAHRG